MNGPRVVLLGPMGAGKTSIGREVAERLGVPFADLDQLIVETTGRSIPEIFASDGEAAFRALEHQVLEVALDSHPGVLALGGGTVTHGPSRALLVGRPTVLLEVDEAVAARRLGGGHGRPLLQGPDPIGRWRTITAARMPLYVAAARWRVDSARGSTGAVARTIIETVAEAPAPGSPPEDPAP